MENTPTGDVAEMDSGRLGVIHDPETVRLSTVWACFGCIPKYLVIDNCPPVVATAAPLHPVFAQGFL